MTVRLDGKVALVTGATSGIGRAIATLFVARGASVVGMARRHQPGEALAKEIEADGGSFSFVAGDITRPEDCERAVAAALEWRGKLDILINNAARTVPTGRIEETSDADWAATIDPNLTGSFQMCRAALGPMQRRQEGVIINIASFAGVQGLVQHGAYGAAKAGLIQLTKVLAVENFGRGVRANAVIMGSVATEGNEAARASIAEGAHGQDWVPGRSRGGPLAPARMQPVDAARAVAVLCSDDAREITGASIAVDRGYSAGWLAATLIQLGVGGLLPDTD